MKSFVRVLPLSSSYPGDGDFITPNEPRDSERATKTLSLRPRRARVQLLVSRSVNFSPLWIPELTLNRLEWGCPVHRGTSLDPPLYISLTLAIAL